VAGRIEDYAIVGDMQSVALICVDGSVDWLCLALRNDVGLRGPRFPWDERRSVPG
jgi:hypothetical protein